MIKVRCRTVARHSTSFKKEIHQIFYLFLFFKRGSVDLEQFVKHFQAHKDHVTIVSELFYIL